MKSLIGAKAQELIEHRTIRPQCGVEVGETFLELEKAQNLLVFHRVAQLELNLIRDLAYLAQIAQEERGRIIQYLEQESRLLERAE